MPNHNSGFSHLGVPAPAGMSDCYESMSQTPIRDRPLRQPLIRHSRHPFVNPAPHSSFVRKCALQSTSMPALHGRNVPNCRLMVDAGMRKCSAGACPPLGSEWGVAESTVSTRHTKSQLRVFTPWCAGPSRDERSLMKACPGLRSGIDRSGSLSFAIRGIPSSIRPHIRHSGEGRNPEGWGGVNPPDDGKNRPDIPRFSSSYAAFARPW